MTAVTSHTPAQSTGSAAPGVPSHAGLAGLVAALAAAFAQARDRARAVASLNRLDDRTLKDIGMHRTEITSIVHLHLQDPSRRPR